MMLSRTPCRQARAALLAVVLLLAFGTLCACAESAPAAGAPQATGLAEFLKQYGLEGRVTLIQFGVIGCPLSEEGIAKMAALDKDHKIADLAFARVEGSAQSKDTDAWFAARSVTFPVRYDAGGALSRELDATAIPTYVLVDKFGRVRYRGPWPDETKLAQWADALNKEMADAGSNAPMFGVAVTDGARLLDETRLPDVEGATKSTRDRMGAKGLMIVFVDTKCPFSATAIGELPNVSAVLAKQGISSVIVNIAEAKPVVEKFYTERKLGLPVMYDESKATQTAWAVTFVPTVVLVDTGGAIVYRGKAVWADIGAAAEKGLKLPAGSLSVTVKGTGAG